MDKTKPGSPGAQGEPSAQDTGSTNGQDELAMRLSDLARDLKRQVDPHDTLLGVARAAVEHDPRRRGRLDQPMGWAYGREIDPNNAFEFHYRMTAEQMEG